MLLRRFFASFPFVLAAYTLLAPAAAAEEYKGKTAQWGELRISLTGGQVTAFETRTGGLQTCAGEPANNSVADPQMLTYSGPPVPVVGGRFHLEGTTENGYGDVFRWTADGSVSLDGREITGTATSSGDTFLKPQCVGTWTFDAIIPPRQVDLPVTRTFTGADNNRSFNPSVTFDYSRGVIRHLTAHVGVDCPSGADFAAEANTTAYRMDPVRVDKSGRFRVAGAVLDDYGVVNRFVLTGRIKGRVATGTVSAYRYWTLRSIPEKCTRDTVWRSVARGRLATNAPTAYYDVVPVRFGSPGAWSYYMAVKITGCARANRVRVSIARGPSRTTGCHGLVRLGPLRPMRTYRVRVTALKLRRGKVVRRAGAVPTSVYLPGEDGDWVRLR